MGKITYYLDGNELTATYGVYVSGSKGLIGRPSLKDAPRVEYADMHGEIVDLTKPRYKAREITLSCFVANTTRDEVVSTINTFMSAVDAPGLHRLEVALDERKILFFEVYRKNAAYATTDWKGSANVATFSVVLQEPSPLKKVYNMTARTGQTDTFTLVATSPVNIFWGDGTCSVGVTSGNLSHTWAKGGAYIVIAGDIDGVTLTRTTEGDLYLWSDGQDMLWPSGLGMSAPAKKPLDTIHSKI